MRITDDGQPATADFRAAYDADNLYISYDVNDPTPWKNSGNGFQLLFKTGDAAVEFVGENNPLSPPSILCRRLRQASRSYPTALSTAFTQKQISSISIPHQTSAACLEISAKAGATWWGSPFPSMLIAPE